LEQAIDKNDDGGLWFRWLYIVSIEAPGYASDALAGAVKADPRHVGAPEIPAPVVPARSGTDKRALGNLIGLAVQHRAGKGEIVQSTYVQNGESCSDRWFLGRSVKLPWLGGVIVAI
jgi:hypothetical protein